MVPTRNALQRLDTLDNFGTIIQTGTGNLGLHSDNLAPTVLKNEPGASYLIESDSGISNCGVRAEIDNAGTIKKTAGTGTSTIWRRWPVQQHRHHRGRFGDAQPLGERSPKSRRAALTAGTWNALNGSTLAFPSGTSITTNQANITLDGNGATIAGLSGLTSNSGSLSLTNGASLTTAGDFSNTGSLTLGAGSTLTVKGNYTQGSAASLTIGIGGNSSGNQYGQLSHHRQRHAGRLGQRLDSPAASPQRPAPASRS